MPRRPCKIITSPSRILRIGRLSEGHQMPRNLVNCVLFIGGNHASQHRDGGQTLEPLMEGLQTRAVGISLQLSA